MSVRPVLVYGDDGAIELHQSEPSGERLYATRCGLMAGRFTVGPLRALLTKDAPFCPVCWPLAELDERLEAV